MIAQGYGFRDAARECGCSYNLVLIRRQEDPEFSRMVAEAQRSAEERCMRRLWALGDHGMPFAAIAANTNFLNAAEKRRIRQHKFRLDRRLSQAVNSGVGIAELVPQIGGVLKKYCPADRFLEMLGDLDQILRQAEAKESEAKSQPK